MKSAQITDKRSSETTLAYCANQKSDNTGLIQPVVDSQVMPAVNQRRHKLHLTVADLAAVGDNLLTSVDWPAERQGAAASRYFHTVLRCRV